MDAASMLDLCILRVEARIWSRRSSTYGTRAAYSLMLLGLFWMFHRAYEESLTGGLLAPNELSRFAATAFEWLGVGQALIVILLVPAMVAGTFAEERSRRTLEVLLAARPSSAAIIVDKLAASMLQLGALLAIGLPIVCLLGLLGGIDPLSVVYAFAGTASIAFFLTALSLLVSVHARRPRGAILLVYLIEVVWFLGPWIAYVAFLSWGRLFARILVVHADWILPATPLSLVTPRTSSGWSGSGPVAWLLVSLRIAPPGSLTAGWVGPAALSVALGRMIVWQLCAGFLFLAWAARRLRPVARRLADAPPRRRIPDWLRGRARSRPPCGANPVLWNERYSRDGGAARLVLGFGLLAFCLLALMSHDSFITHYRQALTELFEYGYTSRLHRWDFFVRERFLSHLQRFSALFYVASLVVVAVKSATGVTSEREAGTWDGVLCTTLEPAEIVRAKVLGALTRNRALLSLVLAPWIFGLALGALHPIGFLMAISGLAVFLFFASALGTLFSLRSKTSGRALGGTLAVLLAFNLVPAVLGSLMMRSFEFGGLCGSTAILLYMLPISNHLMAAIVARPDSGAMLLGVLCASTAAYGALGWFLCLAAIRKFDRIADRPMAP